ncbi:TRAP transporter large permease [Henriciella pelagia]|jgi:tripartite ATP-independent transporter DctM subunit|uniref:C4-dicarboxylate ABC transporter n=1 Tax=Henriciella pelagia TaxID=1977912 RepID=A0ABQ1J2G2_9PROT|nr:TRAP transporter large permease subunit [Henriciella pelagia]GGB58468.1 C4-dicarboxylate ABC transporter [Henriciella pelagia]
MELEVLLALLMFATAIGALLAGYSVALTLGGVALLFALLGIALGVFPEPLLLSLPSRIQGGSIMQNETLVAVPLFVIMGVILERSRVAEDLLHIASRLLGRIRGGLGYAVVLVGALLAASTGIVGATVITMTLIALPSMLQKNYDPRLATGTIAASGTLGQIIPPSIVLILLADAVSNAASQAASQIGSASFVVSVGDLFAGALIPGLILVGLYLSYIAFMAFARPRACPATINEDGPPLTRKEILFGLGAPLVLIIAVLGAILGGVATPTEAAAIGVAGALLLSGLRLSTEKEILLQRLVIAAFAATLVILTVRNLTDLRLGVDTLSTEAIVGAMITMLAAVLLLIGIVASMFILHRQKQLQPAFKSAVHITSMVFLILIGASLFSLVFRGFGGDEAVADILASIPGGRWGALIGAMLVMFLLGFFLDFIEIVFVVVPLVTPPLIVMGFDPVWLAILMALNLQTSFLTPPFGFALFYLRGAAPDTVRTGDIWQGALPFIGLQILMILLVAFLPGLATWLPSLVAK